MALNSSGTISLGGCTVGQSIAKELGRSGTATIDINCSVVRTLGGVPTNGAQISFSNFYGKSFSTNVGTYFGGTVTGVANGLNTATRINPCGAIIGSETNVGTARSYRVAGARVGSYGLFYGGLSTASGGTNIVTRVNTCGALVGSETNVGSLRFAAMGAYVGCNGLFYGHGSCACTSKKVARINVCGALVGAAQTTVAVSKGDGAGASAGSVGVFFGGYDVVAGSYTVTNVTRINGCGNQVGTTCNTSPRQSLAGTKVGSNAMFYGGTYTFFCFDFCGSYTCYGTICYVTRVNACGSEVGTTSTIGQTSGLYENAGSTIGSNGVFYAGLQCNGGVSARAIRINACGAKVGSTTTPGTARTGLGGNST